MPSQPGTVLFPGALDDNDSLIRNANNATTTVTDNPLTSGATTINVAATNTAGASFPATGTITIEGEIIYYTGTTTTSFTGCVRGREGTSAVSHASGKAVDGLITARSIGVVDDAIVAMQNKISTMNTLFMQEDFVSGNSSTTQIGTHGWTTANGSTSLVNAPAGHPGVYNRTTGASALANTAMAYFGIRGNGAGVFLAAENFDMTFICRLNQTDANTEFAVGLIMVPAQLRSTGNECIMIEKAAADTDFFGVCQGSAGATRTAAFLGGAISTTAWYRFRIRRVDASTIGFNVAAGNAAFGTEKTVTTNITTATTHDVTARIWNNNVAAAKTFDFDYWELLITGISRA